MPLRERLHDQHVRQAVDHERGQQIALAVHDAVGGGVDAEAIAIGQRLGQTTAPETGIGGAAARDETDGDGRAIAEQTEAERLPPGPDQGDDLAGARVDLDHVGPRDPQVAGPHAVLAARRDPSHGGRGGNVRRR